MNHNAKPKQRPDYQLEMLEGELILYHLGQTKILYCNESAGLIWRLSDGRLTISEIIAALSDAYPDAAASMASDVEGTLQQFLDAEAIELV